MRSGIGEGAHFGGIDHRLHVNLGDARRQVAQRVVHALATTGAPVVIEVIRKDDAFVGGQCAEREPGLLGSDGRWQSNR